MTSSDDAPACAAKHGSDNPEGAVSRSAPIARPSEELFACWRDFSNLPAVMGNVERVEVLDDRRQHWVIKAPPAKTVEWDAVLTEDRPSEVIAWKSAEGAEFVHSGRIEFSDAGARGTVVTATIVHEPPGGAIGKLVAKPFQREPAVEARRDLRRFEQLMETGEVATASRSGRNLRSGGPACRRPVHDCRWLLQSARRHRLGLEEQDAGGRRAYPPARRDGRVAQGHGNPAPARTSCLRGFRGNATGTSMTGPQSS